MVVAELTELALIEIEQSKGFCHVQIQQTQTEVRLHPSLPCSGF